jgi:spermidine/putrescine transport system ATP-binding protein
LIDGHTYQRRVHNVFQDYALFPHLSVFENVAYSLNVQRYAKADIEERVTDALKCVQLANLDNSRRGEKREGREPETDRIRLSRQFIAPNVP